jgi:transmembrane sensor
MSDLARRLEQARGHVRPDWSDERQGAALANMHLRRKRRGRRQLALTIVACAACVAIALGVWWKRQSPNLPSASTTPPAANTAGALRLEDGSTVVPLASPGGGLGEFTIRERNPERVVVRIDHGAARCDVTHTEARVFRVELGDVAVQVLGTVFEVERVGEGARVAVERGKVRVFWPGHTADLAEGESGVFPPADPAATAASGAQVLFPDEAADASPVAEQRAAQAQQRPGTQWRRLAEQGAFDEAYNALHTEGSAAVNDEVGELFLAADVARLSHHPTEAVAPLRQVLQRHGGDPRASLAAFTLGRLLLDELGRPAEAAAMFAQARRLSPGGELAQDALAREVEARSRAGDTQGARDLAGQYVTQYPNGSRLRMVRRFGGLE